VNKREAEYGQKGRSYGEELLSANWNPAVKLVSPSVGRKARRKERGVSEAEATAFLHRIYRLGA
jgi:hypothetical protein